MTLKSRILKLLESSPGLTDREITDRLFGRNTPQQAVNQACRSLENDGLLERRRSRPLDNLIGNWPTGSAARRNPARVRPAVRHEERPDAPSEDEVKRILERWLTGQGWSVSVRYGHERGIDIEAIRNEERWIIEVKGPGSRQPMRVNYFLAVLGETLQRMSDPRAHYSVAFPDLDQFRRLWQRLPALAKKRTGITAIFVTADGRIQEISGGSKPTEIP